MSAPLLQEATVLAALRQVMDPELGCNVVDLGLIYHVAIQGASVKVIMTLTTPGCPMQASLCAGVRAALRELGGVAEAGVELVWDPPWHPSRMTEAGRAAAGMRKI